MSTKRATKPAEPAPELVVTRHTGYVNMPSGPAVYLLDGQWVRADAPVVQAHPHYFEAMSFQ